MMNREFLAKKSVDAFLTADEKTMWYFARFQSSFGYLVLLPEKSYFITDLRYKEGAEKKLKPKKIEVVCATPATVLDILADLLKNAHTVGVQKDCITVENYEFLQKLGKEFVDMSEDVLAVESVKTDEEIELIRKACEITEKAFHHMLAHFKEGMTELEAVAKLEYRLKKYGGTGIAFDTIIAFGKNASVPHHVPDDTKLKKGMPVLMDFGCTYEGYCSDMTRTIYFGKPTDAFLEAYNTVLLAHYHTRDVIEAGMNTKDADAAARRIIDGSKYKGLFTHSLGHGVGVHIHELPFVSPSSTAVFAENMVFTDEPGIYKENDFGIRIEDTLYIKNGRAVSFMEGNKGLIYIEHGKILKEKLPRELRR